jgi:integrase/recombinase XerD
LNNNQPNKSLPKRLSFVQFADKLIANLHEINKSGNALVYQNACNRMLKYASGKDISFTDINYTFLEGFKSHLMKDAVKINNISNYLRTVRALYNKAIKAKIADRACYSFNDVTIRSEKTAKRAVDIKDLARLSYIDLTAQSTGLYSRNYF